MKKLLVAVLCVIAFTLSAVNSYAASKYRGVTLGRYSEDDLKALASWSNGRPITVRFELESIGVADQNDPATYREFIASSLAKLDSILPTLKSLNIYTILCLYSPPGGFSTHSSPAQHRLFTDTDAQSLFIETWQTIASHYVNEPAILGYELLNEPAQKYVSNGALDWSALAAATAQAIRAIDSNHMILIPVVYGDINRINKLKKINLPNIAYAIHFYDNLNFIHQGVYGRKIGVKYPSGKFNRDSILKYARKAISFSQKNKVKVFVTEITVPRWAPGKSGVAHLRDSIAVCERFFQGWTYQAFRGWHGWDLELGSNPKDLNRTTTDSDRLKLVKSYLKKNKAI